MAWPTVYVEYARGPASRAASPIVAAARRTRPPASTGSRHDDRRRHPDEEHRDAESRDEGGAALEEDARGRGAREDRDGERDAAVPRPRPERPHVDGAAADEGGDRRHESDGVVAVDVPDMRLKTRPVTASQPPHMRYAARRRSVRGARPRRTIPVTTAMRANGRSHATWPPSSALKRRRTPGVPEKPPPPIPPPPADIPKTRARPSYPRTRSIAESVVLPPMNGRDEAGMSSTAATHQADETTTAIAEAASPATRRRTEPGAATAQTNAKAGRTRYA